MNQFDNESNNVGVSLKFVYSEIEIFILRQRKENKREVERV